MKNFKKLFYQKNLKNYFAKKIEKNVRKWFCKKNFSEIFKKWKIILQKIFFEISVCVNS